MDNKLTETGSSNRRVAAVPIWVKPYLTIEEAAEYTGIGRDKLYEMTSLADCPFVPVSYTHLTLPTTPESEGQKSAKSFHKGIVLSR